MRVISALAMAAGAAALLTATAATADATGYRYWSYYHQVDDGWEYAQVRMDGHVPDDGAVEAWRFVTAEFGDTSRTPRVEITFDDVCGDAERDAGQKRVALVIDYGRSADAAADETPPQVRAACAVVEEDATTAMALSSIAELRLDDARLCAVDDYPGGGCNEAVDPLPEDAAEPDDSVELVDVSGLAADPEVDEGVAGDPENVDGGSGSAAESSGDGSRGAWVGVGVTLLAAAGVAVTVRRARRP